MSSSSSSSFVDCGRCGAAVTVNMVLKSARVPSAPGYVAVLWQCCACSFESRTAILGKDWAGFVEASVSADRVVGVLCDEFGKDLSMVGDAGDLLRIWESYGRPAPVVPSPGRRCGCRVCEVKYGGVLRGA